MPVVPAPSAPTHVHGATHFTSLATPSRGATSANSVWRVEIAPGTPATPHRVTREEVFVVLAGAARVQLGDAHHEVVAGDVNGDKLPDVVVGNKRGTFVLLQKSSK